MANTKSNDKEEKELPPVLIVSKFTAARGKEIQIMKSALSSTSGTKLAFQKLPRHMRRRAMSHNVRRLPRRLRQIHLNQMKKSGLQINEKHSSRKHRRRPSNLISEYIRRQKRYKWLNTHIWHAKRFHMIEKWGYKLPYRSCDKTFRACYRATVSHCLLQDISYYRCIEIVGDYNMIVDKFKKISNPDFGLTIAAKAYVKGTREGSITIFDITNKKAIGTIYFHWKPEPIQTKRVLWIWIHPAFYSEVLNNFIYCFNLNDCNIEENVLSKEKLYKGLENCELRELNLGRFRLTGPLSNSILQNCFHLVDTYEKIKEWNTYYGETIGEQMKSRKEYWTTLKNITSTAELSPHFIFSLIIEDPRLYFPKKRGKIISEVTPSKNIHPLPENLAEGPIWNISIRKIAEDTKPSNSVLSEKRRNLLVPGSDLEESGVPVPIMLIQRPGKKSVQNLGYSSGWDVVFPSGWAQPIWLALIMWGARPGGLKETNFINFEMGKPNILYPDTTAGVEEELTISNQYRETYFKLPPNKRTNYNKFRIVSPFEWKWNLLLNDWNTSAQPIKDFFVLRDQKQLKLIQDVLCLKANNLDGIELIHNCLIPVSITLSDKGLCKRFAIICLPQGNDLKNVPMEKNSLDQNEKLRKELRKEHKILLKRMRRRRIRAKKSGKLIPSDMTVLKQYKKKMRELWLPEVKTVRWSCSREVIGFVRDGDFSLLLGGCKAIGYIPMSTLPALILLKCRRKILLRNTNSKQYRIGILDTILNE